MKLIPRSISFVTDHAPQLLLLILVVAFNWTLHQAFFEPSFTSDAIGYLETAQWMKGEDVVVHGERMLKPLAPFFISVLSYLTGDIVSGMILEVGIMYILLACASYIFFFSFFQRKKTALMGAVMLISAYPMLFYGLDLYTETGAIFFYVLAVFGIWKYLTDDRRVWFWVSVATITVGMLWKEYSAASGIFFGLAILFHPSHTLKEKGRDLFLLALVSVGLLGAWQWYVYTAHHFSYLDWYKIGVKGTNTEREYTPYHIAKSLFATLLLAWAIVPIGVAKWKAFSKEEKRFVLLLILPSLMFLLWGYVSSRLYFIIVPIALIFVLHGFRSVLRRHPWLPTLALISILLGNYVWLFANSLFRAML